MKSKYLRIEPYLNRMCKYWFRMKGLDRLLLNRPKEAFPPNWLDLYRLYHFIQRRKHRVILELGSGCTTLIMAQSLLDNHPISKMYTVETQPQWQKVTDDCIKRTFSDTSFIKVNHSDVEMKEGKDGFTYYRHLNIPEIIPSLIYLDSPQLVKSKQSIITDLVDLESKLPYFDIIIDGRLKTFKWTVANLSRQYKITRHFSLGIFEYQHE